MTTPASTPRQPINAARLMTAWGRLLRGYSPLLSIEITRECPLHCPGCYAYEKIIRNLEGRVADISWVITNQMLLRPGYLDDYLAFWTARPEIERIWLSLYTPQRGEVSDERITPDAKQRLLEDLPILKRKYPGLIFPDGAVSAFTTPPSKPMACTFARVSVNYTADLKTRIEPCFFGGNPDCSECGCAVSAGLHWLHGYRLAPGLTAGHLIDASLAIGRHPRRQVRRMLPVVNVG